MSFGPVFIFEIVANRFEVGGCKLKNLVISLLPHYFAVDVFDYGLWFGVCLLFGEGFGGLDD